MEIKQRLYRFRFLTTKKRYWTAPCVLKKMAFVHVTRFKNKKVEKNEISAELYIINFSVNVQM